MQIKFISTDSFQVCCTLYDVKAMCTINVMQHCQKLLPSKLFQVFGMLNGVFVLVVNGVTFLFSVQIYFSGHGKRKTSKVFEILVSVLHGSDILMAVYILTLAVKDLIEGDAYIERSFSWKQSLFCYLLSVISFFSSIFSSFTTFLLGLFRFFVVVYPMKILPNSNRIKLVVFLLSLIILILSITILYIKFQLNPTFQTPLCILIEGIESKTIRKITILVTASIWKIIMILTVLLYCLVLIEITKTKVEVMQSNESEEQFTSHSKQFTIIPTICFIILYYPILSLIYIIISFNNTFYLQYYMIHSRIKVHFVAPFWNKFSIVFVSAL